MRAAAPMIALWTTKRPINVIAAEAGSDLGVRYTVLQTNSMLHFACLIAGGQLPGDGKSFELPL